MGGDSPACKGDRIDRGTDEVSGALQEQGRTVARQESRCSEVKETWLGVIRAGFGGYCHWATHNGLRTRSWRRAGEDHVSHKGSLGEPSSRGGSGVGAPFRGG